MYLGSATTVGDSRIPRGFPKMLLTPSEKGAQSRDFQGQPCVLVKFDGSPVLLRQNRETKDKIERYAQRRDMRENFTCTELDTRTNWA